MINNGFNRFPNYISDIPESLYKQIESFTFMLDGVARLTNQCFYLIDFYKGEVLYASNNPMLSNKLSAEEILKKGKNFNKLYTSAQEYEQIYEIIRSWLHFIENVPVEERKSHTLQFDYWLIENLICIHLTPIFLCNEGKPWLVLCNAKLSINKESGNAIILKENHQNLWSYSFKSKKWHEKPQVILTDIEKQVLCLSLKGKKENEICEQIFRSKDGLKSIKRKLFKKMDVTNITEAVSFAILYGLLQKDFSKF